MKFRLMSSSWFSKKFSIPTFDMLTIYWNRLQTELTRLSAVSDCNALFTLSFIILLLAALYIVGRCLAACPPNAITVGFFIIFLTKWNIPRLLSPLLFLPLGTALCLYLRLMVICDGNSDEAHKWPNRGQHQQFLTVDGWWI